MTINELNTVPNPPDTDSEAESLDSSHGDMSSSTSSSPARSQDEDDVLMEDEYEVAHEV